MVSSLPQTLVNTLVKKSLVRNLSENLAKRIVGKFIRKILYKKYVFNSMCQKVLFTREASSAYWQTENAS